MESLKSTFIYPAMSEEYATLYNTGDYLSNSVENYSCSIIQKDKNEFSITLNVKYYTTDNQESEFDNALIKLMNELNLRQKSDYEKCRIIYSYITSHVEYDKDAYEGSFKEGKNKLAYTAYSALIQGKSVCQGYSSLFYAMCKYEGLPVRIVPGKANNGRIIGEHAWNIVRINKIWYYVDSTWDEHKNQDDWGFFLVGSNNISRDHFIDKEYLTRELANYSISECDFSQT